MNSNLDVLGYCTLIVSFNFDSLYKVQWNEGDQAELFSNKKKKKTVKTR